MFNLPLIKLYTNKKITIYPHIYDLRSLAWPHSPKFMQSSKISRNIHLDLDLIICVLEGAFNPMDNKFSGI
ncbi:hypothetical protein HanPSC8_Chr08g0320691 [Helianthus annuus]|nr:hypothetical protein HanPSC8_Chr08g0320691 [Helianthus annuus]